MVNTIENQETICGYVAIVGRPNVGKSTLLNRLIGEKISITSHKPQTTRHRLLGVKTFENVQIIYVDTPGIHNEAKKALNRYMNRSAVASMFDVDVILFMVDRLKWTDDDELVLKKLKQVEIPVILVINKIDRLEDKVELLPYIKKNSEMELFKQIIPVSAKTADNLEQLEQAIKNYLPKQTHFFPPDQLTDRSERFSVAEIIREKLMRNLNAEIPYALTVEIEEFKHEGNLIRISAIIWVERDSQKAIIIGKAGAKLKLVATKAREDMEKILDNKVFLRIWVKVRSGWSDDERALQSLGYEE